MEIHTWGTDLSGSLQGAGGVGGLLMVEEITSTTTTAYHFQYDGNGNVTEITDHTGASAATYRYDAFGNTLVATGSYAAANRYRFSTKPLDNEIANAPLYYYGYRYYDPVTGRWPSRDPIGERGGVNLYGFVGNNGVNWWDYLGLELEKVNKINYFEGPVSNPTSAAETQAPWQVSDAIQIQNLGGGKCKLTITGKLMVSVVYPDKSVLSKKVSEVTVGARGRYADNTVKEFETKRAEVWKKAWNEASDDTSSLEKTYNSPEEAEEARSKGNRILNAHLQKAAATQHAMTAMTYGHLIGWDVEGALKIAAKTQAEGNAVLKIETGK